MSRMIPPFYEESITSDGEKKLFRALQNLSDDFVILHSLGIAEHREKVFGEIDFVIVCEEGILCLEVKGGLVRREKGLWYFIDRYGKENVKAEGPFEQVIGSMYSLRDHLKKHFGSGDPVSKCQYACGVVFPDMPFTCKGVDIIPEIIFDARRAHEDVVNYIYQVFNYWRNRLKEKYGFAGGKLNRNQIDRIAGYLRGDFGFVPSLGYIVEQTDNRLLFLTREQANRLAMAAENPRILLKGVAGTGKTLLSLEHARRCVLTGKKVLYLCFNRNLSRYLKMQVKDLQLQTDQLRIETMHSYLIDCLKQNDRLPLREDVPADEYYGQIVPETFLRIVERGDYTAEYDTLIVDEGQDLLRLEYIMCMDAIVRGGLKDGNWHICYDPNQNIYNPNMEAGLEMIYEYRPVILHLDTNCRNTRQIGIYNVLATCMSPARYLKVGGESVIRKSYTDFADERNRVVRAVKKLLSQGILPGKICLLSRYRFENSCLQGENIFRGICSFQNITDLDPVYMLKDSLKFCTIHSFKGLEAPVVFVLDVESLKGDHARLLNYTAISRATSLLYIFYRKDLEDEWDSMVQQSVRLLDEIAD
ncbi:MAG: NERD domain-containing protein [Syntrophothermus sp.]|uniref:nuclease-related domain-containing DEAD/DEAH box helicase n=1 Tax=Syntrophothermus sp. TaxID=2736299 RepID=UPI00257E6910|nr:NERD domain-containing protein [Syntrophothermus sp.]NSW84102.1 NERD domain-containing protein [Syntrophothermus sp.]